METTNEKQKIERRRLVEHLTTARINAEETYKRLLSVGIFNTDAKRAAKIEDARRDAKSLLEQVEKLLRDAQGE